MRFLLQRASFWVALITIIAYWDEQSLNGSFVYDDQGSVKANVVVSGQVPLQQVWERDFWGTPMHNIQSHKSFRPITTLSFRLNWILANKDEQNNNIPDTFGFHLVNLLLHALVTALATEVAASCVVVKNTTVAVWTGLLFGLHPVHVEAVTNITSRGELLMSLFSLSAFLSFATRQQTVIAVYVIPLICMTLALFSKEQGATTLLSIVLWDVIHRFGSVRELLRKWLQGNREAVQCVLRSIILGFQTIVICLWRYYLNGETSPDFIFDQNPAGFSSDRFTRVFSVSWVYCLYIFDAIYPKYLCPDWSGVSIPLIEHWKDWRILPVLLLWSFAAGCTYSLLFGGPKFIRERTQKIILASFFAFCFSPFLLSSNLLVVVGLMKADRVIYLPLLGFCMLQSFLFDRIFGLFPKSSKASSAIGHVLLLSQLFFFTRILHERNRAWSSQLALWMSAYRVNPVSYHTQYNCGYELSLVKRYRESEQVLRPIASPFIQGPSNTFVYAMVLYNLERCDLALGYIRAALEVIESKRREGGPRNTESSLNRVKSNLLVAKGYCSKDITLMGKLFYDAVQVDPRNQYAIDNAAQLANRLKAAGLT